MIVNISPKEVKENFQNFEKDFLEKVEEIKREIRKSLLWYSALERDSVFDPVPEEIFDLIVSANLEENIEDFILRSTNLIDWLIKIWYLWALNYRHRNREFYKKLLEVLLDKFEEDLKNTNIELWRSESKKDMRDKFKNTFNKVILYFRDKKQYRKINKLENIKLDYYEKYLKHNILWAYFDFLSRMEQYLKGDLTEQEFKKVLDWITNLYLTRWITKVYVNIVA